MNAFRLPGIALVGGFLSSLLIGCGVEFDRQSLPSRKAEDIIGVMLPPSATNVKAEDHAGFFGGNYFVSAEIPHGNFRDLAEQLKLRHRTDLLEYWPSALKAQEIDWWDVTSTNDQDTYFGDSETSTYIVMRYERGRVFFKRHVY